VADDNIISTYMRLSSRDNIGVAVSCGLVKGAALRLDGDTIVLRDDIPFGHKFALRGIPEGDPVLKYGQAIGIAQRNIAAGEHVHVGEIRYFSESNAFFIEGAAQSDSKLKILPETFLGYPRGDGRVGTRNYIAVVSSVNCSATVVKKITRAFENYAGTKNIDGIIPVTYGGGCAQAFESRCRHLICETIAGWVDHPNVVAAVIVGLGCETVNIESILEKIPGHEQKNIRAFTIQEAGGSREAVDFGIKTVNDFLEALPVFERKEVSVGHLSLGLNCGGSDAFSGLTANPALGFASDILVSKNGVAVLAETPECNGAEEHLKSRCVQDEDREKLNGIIGWWAEYASFHRVEMNDNLSKGNMEGGISTILEKSLGAVAKAGSAPISGVLNYAERIGQSGLLFMDTPGFDPVSVTGLIAGGCNMIAFTTGRGSVFNTSIVPTVKISSNSEMKNRLPGDMDFDAGVILRGRTVEEVGMDIYTEIVAVASGKKTKGEEQQMGMEEFVPWQFGEIL
jgi:altronate dehydratase